MAFNFSNTFGPATINSISAKSVADMATDAIAQEATKYVGKYIPSTVVGTATSLSGISRLPNGEGVTNTTNRDPLDNYKVKLISATNLHSANPDQIERVVFDATPTVNEDRMVEYNAVSPIHMPGSVQVYKRTAARSFAISAPLISRTREEATKNMQILQTLRGWTMPYFGAASGTGSYSDPKGDGKMRASAELLGAPPDVLYLYAYSSSTSRDGKSHVNLNRIPVVLSQLGIAYPDDVDYLPTFFDNKEPMPVKMLVSIALLETHSPYEYEQFSLQSFKAGKLKHF